MSLKLFLVIWDVMDQKPAVWDEEHPSYYTMFVACAESEDEARCMDPGSTTFHFDPEKELWYVDDDGERLYCEPGFYSSVWISTKDDYNSLRVTEIGYPAKGMEKGVIYAHYRDTWKLL